MSDDDKRLSETQRWMSYARRDLLAGQVLLNQTDNFNTQICFQAQQAAEKAIKAGIVFLGAKP
ncbi:MAG: HEPN domain-containing protein, partial [Cyanobacteria bacterium J06598_3]